MNISYNWLKDYLKIDKTVHELAEILTAIGLEVGTIEEKETVKGGLKGLVVGEVLTCKKHPNADRLSVTTVNIGSGEILPIVCGAPNVAAGQKVIVAPVGTTLYDGDEPFSLKKVKIRGETSQGMICSEAETGLGTDHDGIMVLDPETAVGSSVAEYFNIESDFIMEIDLTPNRIDSASHLGVARDVAAYMQVNNSNIEVKRPSVEAFKPDNNNYTVKITVEDSKTAPRYSGLTMSGIKVADSPAWLKNRLISIGMTPINNIVDITNFVLYETGQPLHAFDGDKIINDHIIVKTLPQGSKFTTLDEVERELHETDLMICNEKEGMCIAGVFGGLDSSVTNTTTKLFLESACFNPVYVRQTSRRHMLYTDAAFRFERGSDPNMTIYALKRAALLIKEIAGGQISSEIIDVYPDPVKDFEVSVSWSNITKLIGKEIDRNLIKKILTSLEIQIKEENEKGMELTVPPYRVDVHREADIIEEILRIYGYNNIENPDKINSSLVYQIKPDHHKLRNEISMQLIAAGFQEIMCNSLTKASYYDDSTAFPRSKTVELANPLSSDLNAMRQTLLFGGLETIRHNRNHQHPDLKLFESGNCYFLKEKGDLKMQESYIEQEALALFMTGKYLPTNWNTPSRKIVFADLKVHVENILKKMNIKPEQYQLSSIIPDLLSDGICFNYGNTKLVELGIVDPKLLNKFDIDEAVFFAEFNWNNLVKIASKQIVAYTELSKYPEVKRDLALLLDHKINFEEIEKVARKTEKKLLKNISLFDVYKGEKLGEDKKSYAVSFTLEDNTKTLTDERIDKTMRKLITAFEKELGAKLRS